MPVLLYKKLYEELKGRILSGYFREGDLLPSEHVLMNQHRVTRSTVRHALTELEHEGYIVKKQGLGSQVQRIRKRTLGLLSVKGFSEVVSGQKEDVKTIMLEKPAIHPWEEPFFYVIGDMERSAGCIRLRRIRCTGKEPVMLESTFVPNINLPGFCDNAFVNGSLFETLNVKYQVEITDVEQDLRAVLADSKVAHHLKVKPESPLLHIWLRFHTNREHLHIYSSLLCNTDKYSIGNKL